MKRGLRNAGRNRAENATRNKITHAIQVFTIVSFYGRRLSLTRFGTRGRRITGTLPRRVHPTFARRLTPVVTQREQAASNEQNFVARLNNYAISYAIPPVGSAVRCGGQRNPLVTRSLIDFTHRPYLPTPLSTFSLSLSRSEA